MFVPYILLIEFSKLTLINKQGKVEELLVKKADLEATIENLEEKGKEMKDVLQIREVWINNDSNMSL